jgi:hypothetical protein
MADGDGVRADSDFPDEQAHDLLSLRNVERLGARAQAGPKVGQRLTQP